MSREPRRKSQPMQLAFPDGPAAFDCAAADCVIDALAAKPDSVVALPTGRTPVGVYSILPRRAASRSVLLCGARWFNLDDYVGLGVDHPMSYARFIREHLLDRIGASDRQVRLLRADAPDCAAECRAYDAAITAAGGIDLAILGLGANGHIAFNEPGCAWDRDTHVTELTEQTRIANAAAVSDPSCLQRSNLAPRLGITMGIGTLRRARRILLLVKGLGKRAALNALLQAVPDAQWPVTSLLGHPDLTVIADSRLRSPA